MQRKKWVVLFFAFSLVMVLLAVGQNLIYPIKKDGNPVLTIYCAAGLGAPVEMLAREYEELHGIKIELIYGSSGDLRTQIKSQGKGDIYIPGDPRFLEEIDYIMSQEIAYHFPVLIVNNTQTDNLKTFPDLANSDLSFILVKPDSTALGLLTEEIMSGIGLDQGLDDRLYGRVATANQVPLYLSLGRGGAGICWYSNYLLYEEELVIIDLPIHLQKQVPIIGVVLSSSQNSEKAWNFLHYLKSERAKEVFIDWGYRL